MAIAFGLSPWGLVGPARAAEPLAFPGAVGFGASATGGRGGDVYVVTTLADGGPGSLREAVGTASGPRTIVFEVSGTIDLGSTLRIVADDLTIAGQTAGGGITLRGYPTVVLRSENVILRYLRFRPGDVNAAGVPGRPGRGNADLNGGAADALSILGSHRVIVDHVSASWSMDETLSVTKSTDVTIQHSIISESLDDSFHPEGRHGYGSLVRGMGSRGYTFFRNLWAHHDRRSPALGGQQDPPPDGLPGLGLDADLVGNVIYDWGFLPTHTVSMPWLLRVNMIGNTWISGPSLGCLCILFQIEGTADEVRVFEHRNHFDSDRDALHDPIAVSPGALVGLVTWVDDVFAYDRIQPPRRAPRVAYARVLKTAGASHARDGVDARIVEQVRTRTGGLIDSQDEVGGWPPDPVGIAVPADLDRDGMADDWERRRGLDPADPDDRNGFDLRRRYTNLEVYLNSLARTGPALAE